MADEDDAADLEHVPKRRCVTLADGGIGQPGNEGASTVVIGNCVSATAVSRSELLTGIHQTEGLASLPGHLAPEDIRLWEAACVVDVHSPTDELVTVLKVADALGDQNDRGWVEKLAQRAAHMNWGGSEHADTTLASLLRLPPHLLHRVLAACFKHRDETHILHTFPQSLHLAAVSAMFPSGHLHLCSTSAERILSYLPSIPTPHAPLTDVVLSSAHSGQFSAASGALLARAVAAHTSLTSLSLRAATLHPQWLRSFTACLAPGALPRLSTLHMLLEAYPGSCPELAACLRHLPALTSLDLTLRHNHGSARPEESLSTFARHAAAPSRLPSLVRLKVYEPPVGESGEPERDSSAHSLLSLLIAPALEFLTLHLSPSSVPVAALFRTLTGARFPALQALEFKAALSRDEMQGSVPTHDSDAATLPALRSLIIESPCQASTLAMANAAGSKAEPSALKRLTVSLSEDQDEPYDSSVTRVAFTMAWTPFFTMLAKLVCLETLSLSFFCGLPPAASQTCSHSVCNSLNKLTQLRHLDFGARHAAVRLPRPGVHLSGTLFGAALAKLDRLERLRFASGEGGLSIRFDAVQPVLNACSKLIRLTELQLCFEGVTLPLVSALIPKLKVLASLTVSTRLQVEFGGDFAAMVAKFSSIQITADS